MHPSKVGKFYVIMLYNFFTCFHGHLGTILKHNLNEPY